MKQDMRTSIPAGVRQEYGVPGVIIIEPKEGLYGYIEL